MSCDHPNQKDLFSDTPVVASGKVPEQNTPKRSNNAAPVSHSTKVPLHPARADAPQYLTDRDVGKRFSISRPTVWRWSNDPNNGFPAPIKLSQGVTRWRLQDLLAFEAGLRAEGGRK